MKILENGNPWSVEVRCTGGGNSGYGCGALLLVEQDDVYRTRTFERDGPGDEFNTIRCASCGRATDLKGKVPFTPHPTEPPHSIERKKPGVT